MDFGAPDSFCRTGAPQLPGTKYFGDRYVRSPDDEVPVSFFPKSDLTTIELPEDDPIYLSTYSRETRSVREQIEKRMHANLAQTQAMQLRVNSFFLPAQCKKKLTWSGLTADTCILRLRGMPAMRSIYARMEGC